MYFNELIKEVFLIMSMVDWCGCGVEAMWMQCGFGYVVIVWLWYLINLFTKCYLLVCLQYGMESN